MEATLELEVKPRQDVHAGYFACDSATDQGGAGQVAESVAELAAR